MNALSYPHRLPLPNRTPAWRAKVCQWLLALVGLGLVCAGCAGPGPKTKAQAGVFPRPGAKITVGTVTNATGQSFPKDVEAALKAALTRAIERGRADGSIASPDEPRSLARFLVVGLGGLEVMARAKSERVRLDDAVTLMMAALD